MSPQKLLDLVLSTSENAQSGIYLIESHVFLILWFQKRGLFPVVQFFSVPHSHLLLLFFRSARTLHGHQIHSLQVQSPIPAALLLVCFAPGRLPSSAHQKPQADSDTDWWFTGSTACSVALEQSSALLRWPGLAFFPLQLFKIFYYYLWPSAGFLPPLCSGSEQPHKLLHRETRHRKPSIFLSPMCSCILLPISTFHHSLLCLTGSLLSSGPTSDFFLCYFHILISFLSLSLSIAFSLSCSKRAPSLLFPCTAHLILSALYWPTSERLICCWFYLSFNELQLDRGFHTSVQLILHASISFQPPSCLPAFDTVDLFFDLHGTTVLIFLLVLRLPFLCLLHWMLFCHSFFKYDQSFNVSCLAFFTCYLDLGMNLSNYMTYSLWTVY